MIQIEPDNDGSNLSPSMQRLNAYWRMPYILNPKDQKDTGNPFASIFKCSDDKKVHILYRGTHTYIIMNKFPYNAGHLMVLPYREVSELKDMETVERNELMDLIVKAQDILTKALKPDGFNIGFNIGDAAGAGIPGHLHCHIVPRWNGDTNFMPVISNTRILPDSMDTMWERLHSYVNFDV